MNPLFHMFFQQYRFLVNRLNDTLKEFGLYNSQWTILFLLHQEGPMSLTSIWKYLNVEAPTITRTVARLEKLGLVERQQGDDRREKIVSLTPEAIELFPKVENSIMTFEEKMVSNLTGEEQEQLAMLLKKMKG
ncbi:MarR family winged helix-turn-helix transcriptional regulator [Lysinibacillus sp. 54212]|uniref:MarR family winged helix-turn-helix transcriptional regulator n=1 Tax=Lysinibacillus sp. 54212 TaxID=3119829 RepID=UPI002FC73A0F